MPCSNRIERREGGEDQAFTGEVKVAVEAKQEDMVLKG